MIGIERSLTSNLYRMAHDALANVAVDESTALLGMRAQTGNNARLYITRLHAHLS